MTDMLPPNVIVADDHCMVRKGIKLLLSERLNCKQVAEADSCNSLMNELRKGAYTQLILDVVFADGTSLEIVPIIKRLYPMVQIMVYSMQPMEIYAEAFRQYDITHYLSKGSGEQVVVATIKRFLENEACTEAAKPVAAAVNLFATLAPRELEILHYLLNGYKTTDIAKTLNLGNSTVSTMKARIFEKTHTSNLAQLFEIAALNNLNFYVNTPKYQQPAGMK
jgi:DNA-binding NarL/FixJ family response regulator